MRMLLVYDNDKPTKLHAHHFGALEIPNYFVVFLDIPEYEE